MGKTGFLLLAAIFMAGSSYAFEADGIYYNETAAGECEVTYPEDGTYKGQIIIPPTVEFEGTTYAVTGIGDYAFAGCEDVSSIDVPESVSSIGRNAFQSCDGIKEMSLPLSVTELKQQTFYDCSSIERLDAKGITGIGESAFSGCISLSKLSVNDNISSIGTSAFRNCTSLTAFDLPGGINLGEGVFYGCSGLTTVTFDDSITRLPPYTFSGCEALESVAGIGNIEEFGDYCFYSCTGLGNIEFSKTLKRIGHNAFAFCSSLSEIDIECGEGVVEAFAFTGCGKLEKVTLNGIYEVEEEAFSESENLESVSLGENIMFIRERVFRNCSNLMFVACWAEQPPITAPNAFDKQTYDMAYLEVPDSKTLLYRQTYPWTYFLHIGEVSVESVPSADSEMRVIYEENRLKVLGAHGPVIISDMAGKIIFSGVKDTGNLEVAVPSTGIYIVKTPGKSYKIVCGIR